MGQCSRSLDLVGAAAGQKPTFGLGTTKFQAYLCSASEPKFRIGLKGEVGEVRHSSALVYTWQERLDKAGVLSERGPAGATL